MVLPMKSGTKQSAVKKEANNMVGTSAKAKASPIGFVQLKEEGQEELQIITGVFRNDDGSLSGRVKDGVFVRLVPFENAKASGFELQMGEDKDKMEKVVSIFNKTSKAGTTFCSGSIKKEDGTYGDQFFLFYKKADPA